MVQFAKVFQSGNSQAVRLPKEFRFDVDRVMVSREGDAIVLRPVETDSPWASLEAAVQRGVSIDFMPEGRSQPEDQPRPGLEDVFR